MKLVNVKLSTKGYLKKIARTATKEVGYAPQKGKYFLGSLPIGTVFDTGRVKGVLVSSSVNVQVTIFDTYGIGDKDFARTMIGKNIWAWATEVAIIKLGKIPEGEPNDDTLD